MPDADGRMTRDELDDAEEVVELAARIALAGAFALALPTLSMAWGRARAFWVGSLNVLGLESSLLNVAYVGLLASASLSALFAVEALWHGRPRRVGPAIVLHVLTFLASALVAVTVVGRTYRGLLESATAPFTFALYMGLAFGLLGLAGLIYNLAKGKRTAHQVDRAIRASLKG
jgi:hypothetical protein